MNSGYNQKEREKREAFILLEYTYCYVMGDRDWPQKMTQQYGDGDGDCIELDERQAGEDGNDLGCSVVNQHWRSEEGSMGADQGHDRQAWGRSAEGPVL